MRDCSERLLFSRQGETGSQLASSEHACGRCEVGCSSERHRHTMAQVEAFTAAGRSS